MINGSIKKLVQYGIDTSLIGEEERIYTTNLILDVLKIDQYEDTDLPQSETTASPEELEETLRQLLDYAYKKGVLEDNGITARDLFDTRLMNCLTPRPGEVIRKFWDLYECDPKRATEYFYQLSQDNDYIRRYRIKKDIRWVTQTCYGDLDITINMSKPEKDPRAIAAQKNQKQEGYPKCLLCMENEGYAGRIDHPARQNHRVIPVTIAGSKWGFQYSPYVYFNEHCIVFSGEHTPMKINREAFVKLFDFIRLFPHYCLGSNADLPIVGGSILSHDHFQGGNYDFPMAKAPYINKFQVKGYEDVESGIINWPVSVIRIRCKDEKRLIDLAEHILDRWRNYTDEDSFIFAHTGEEPHNTITPIARKKEEFYELDLALRNNITTEEYPLGAYHPHQELHHIKKENIGLIEVMGLAILPARLNEEMQQIREYLIQGKDIRTSEILQKHADWVESFQDDILEMKGDVIDAVLKQEVGKVFMKVLEDAGVYKMDEKGIKNFMKFIFLL